MQKVILVEFANNLYISTNYFYNGSQNADNSSLGQAAVVLSAGTTTTSFIDFNLSDAGANNPNVKVRIISNGNVGIGTTSPATKLDLTGTLGFTVGSTSAIIRRTTVNGSNGIVIQGNANDTVSDTNAGASIYVGGGVLGDTYEGNIDFTAYGSIVDANRNQIRFFNRSGVNTVTERMRINHIGNVGIGTASPSAKFHVYGDATDNVGLALFQNTYNPGVDGVYYPAASFINVRGTHSYGIVSEFRTNTSG